jgi:hypothetical protein
MTIIKFKLNIKFKADNDIPAFGAYFHPSVNPDDHNILLNVQACFSTQHHTADGEVVPMTREDRTMLVIASMMHEFGHALESHFRMPLNERFIEKACEAWESKYYEQQNNTES